MRKAITLTVAGFMILCIVITGCGKASVSEKKETKADSPIVTENTVTTQEETIPETLTEVETTTEQVIDSSLSELSGHLNPDDGIGYAVYENAVLSIELPADWKINDGAVDAGLWVASMSEDNHLVIQITKDEWNTSQIEKMAEEWVTKYGEIEAVAYPALLYGQECMVLDHYNSTNVTRTIYAETPDGTKYGLSFSSFSRDQASLGFDYSAIEDQMNHAIDTLVFK